jgi:hypothetical protein
VAPATTPTDALRLQRTIGNQAASRVLSGAARPPRRRAARVSGAVLQRDLVLNGRSRATAEEVRQDLGADFDAMRGTVDALIGLPVVVKLGTAGALREVHAFWTNRTRPASREAMAAGLQLLSHGAWTHTRTQGTAAKPIFDAFNTPAVMTNLADLGAFLRANPNVGANLAAAGVGWELMSTHSQITGFGGAAVIKDRIHIDPSTLAETSPEGLKRTAVHEAGHGSFQRMLITGEGWTDAANTALEQPAERALDADGRRLYDAWRVLRQRPEFFFVVQMPGGRSESSGEGRQKYLAGQFTEFCADSFMHMALKKNELVAHVAGLPDTEPAVKSAWQTALSILTQYEPQILGRQAGAGVATLVGHRSNLRFIAVIEQLKAALRGRTLEAAEPEQARMHVDSLREAWNGLTPAGRERHRREALTTLDQFMWKVLRRRPAQVHVGSELGFVGL